MDIERAAFAAETSQIRFRSKNALRSRLYSASWVRRLLPCFFPLIMRKLILTLTLFLAVAAAYRDIGQPRSYIQPKYGLPVGGSTPDLDPELSSPCPASIQSHDGKLYKAASGETGPFFNEAIA